LLNLVAVKADDLAAKYESLKLGDDSITEKKTTNINRYDHV